VKKYSDITRKIATFALNLSYESIPLEIIEYAKTLIIDQLGVSFAAYGTPIHHVYQKILDLSFGYGKAPVWGAETKSTLSGAVLHNTLLGTALDLDDGHRRALGHPGAAIIPAAMTVAETRNKSGKALIEAIIAAYEVAIRVSMARDLDRLENVYTGAWGAFGAGIASGKMIFSEIEPIQNILGLAAMYGPTLPGSIPSPRRMVKEGIPWSAMVGVQAALFTEAGFEGPKCVFDYLSAYDPDKLTYELNHVFLIKDTYIKQYSCCRWIHPIVLLCHRLKQEEDINVNDIKEIRVKTISRALSFSNKIPQTIEDAQFSIPFCSALTLTKGESALHLIDHKYFRDPEILRLSQTVTLQGDEELEVAFPGKVGTKVEIKTREKVFSKSLIAPIKGDAEKPFSREEVKEKYLIYAKPVVGDIRAENLIRFIENLEGASNVRLSKFMGLNK